MDAESKYLATKWGVCRSSYLGHREKNGSGIAVFKDNDPNFDSKKFMTQEVHTMTDHDGV